VLVVITADTHVPGRAGDLPPALWYAIEGAGVTLHRLPPQGLSGAAVHPSQPT
jgi:hypothetical protein